MKQEFTVEMEINGVWETPRKIFAASQDAAVRQARALIKKHDADRTRLWGMHEIYEEWKTLEWFHGKYRTLYRF
jgi:hypothetical protein